MGEYVDTLLIYLIFIGDMWILGDYLNVRILECEGENKLSIFWC